MLTVERLSVRYCQSVALDIREPVTIEPGDRIGVIGSNGAGKTTLVRTLLGLTRYEGIIRTELRFTDMSAHMQQNSYVRTMPVKSIIEAILNTRIRDNAKLRELIGFFELESSLNKRYQALSGGQQQRMTIIMVLMQDKPLTFMDEVTTGLDFETRQRLMGKIAQWYQGREQALCIVSHYYDELEALVKKLLILDHGRVVAFGGVRELFDRFCGQAVIIIDNTQHNRELTEAMPRISAPEHLLALPCRDAAEEGRLTAMLTQRDINYKRSNNDIEIMFDNAVKQFAGGERI